MAKLFNNNEAAPKTETLPEKRQETAVAKASVEEMFPVHENLEGVEQPELSVVKIIREPASFNVDDEPRKSFRGYVLAAQRQNVYWEGDYTGENKMPDCFSRDTIKPDPSSEDPQAETCATCPRNQWGSDRKGGKGRDCKNTRTLLVLIEGDALPSLLRCSPTNLRPWDRYASNLMKRNKHYATVLTRFELTEKQYDKGKFPQLVLKMERELDPENEADWQQMLQNRDFRKRYQAVVAKDMATQEDVAGDTGTGDPF